MGTTVGGGAVLWIRIQDPDSVNPDPSRILMKKKLRKKIQLEKIHLFLIKNCNLLIPRPP
jgi:hypothetical protein